MKKQSQPYHQLIVWKEAHRFVLDIYSISEKFPKHEQFGITSQLRRAAVSIELNIVEGHAKQSRIDLLRYLNIANGSLCECAAIIEICFDLGYLTQEQYDELESQRRKTGSLLHKFVQGIRKHLKK